MTVRCFHWELIFAANGGVENHSEVDLAQAPDTVFFEFYSLSQDLVDQFFESGAAQELNVGLKSSYYHWELGPIAFMEVDLAQAPDTVFQMWESFGQSDVPFLPRDDLVNPRLGGFAGDMGAYIG